MANPLSQAVQVTQSQKRKKNQKERRETDRSPHYLVVFVLVWDLQRLHGLDHGLHGGEDVLVDQPGEASLVLVRVSAAMDDPHLLDESALPTFPGACSRHTHTQTLVNTPTEKELSHHVPLRRKRKLKVFATDRTSTVLTSPFKIKSVLTCLAANSLKFGSGTMTRHMNVVEKENNAKTQLCVFRDSSWSHGSLRRNVNVTQTELSRLHS